MKWVILLDQCLRIFNNKGRIVSGTPEQVKQQLTALADAFDAEEIIVTCMTFSQEDRIRSFTLLAETFELWVFTDRITWKNITFVAVPNLGLQRVFITWLAVPTKPLWKRRLLCVIPALPVATYNNDKYTNNEAPAFAGASLLFINSFEFLLINASLQKDQLF